MSESAYELKHETSLRATMQKYGHLPPNRPPVIASGFADGDIERLGDRIASLNKDQTEKLLEYFAKQEAKP